MKMTARMQKKHWVIRPTHPHAEELAGQLQIPSLVAQILLNRQITSSDEAKSFISPSLMALIEPEDMPGVSAAADRVCEALANKEKVTIYGDYDVDGITSISILWHLLTILDGAVEYYIPHRIEEGYGLNEEAIRQIAANGTKLLITVDCGICAVDEAALAESLGMDVIITDHHKVSGDLPKAVAIVHPGLDGEYGNPASAGAMVAFKLAWAIVNRQRKGSETPADLRQFLLNATTLAAMGTVADVVDLRGENRILTSYGLKAIGESKLAGIQALIDAADLAGQDIDSYHIAFRLGPMLNAAGRMGHARLAVELLTADSEVRCMQIAEYLKQQNRQRQGLQRKIFKRAKEMITEGGLNHPDRKTVVLADEGWHSGVIGIVASRVVDDFFRPAILINTGNDIGQGSCRSVEGFDMYAALEACSEHLVSFGGHAMAAGLKIEAERIGDFAAAFEEYAREHISDQMLAATIDIEAECAIKDLSYGTVRHISLLEPFGRGNPKPTFATKGVHRIAPPRKVGQRGDHLQIAISDDTGSVRCIGFNMGRLEKKLLEAETFSVAYEPELNTFNGNTNVQFVLTDIQFD